MLISRVRRGWSIVLAGAGVLCLRIWFIAVMFVFLYPNN